MKPATEIFIFKTDPDKRDRAIVVLNELQKEIVAASNGGIRDIRTLISSSDEVTISQIYEWDDVDNAKRVNDLFFQFKIAKELQTLNKDNVFMGQLLEVDDTKFER